MVGSNSAIAAALVALLVGAPQRAAAEVNCGGHFASFCSACPQGNGEAWCNGDCAWTQDPWDSQGGACITHGQKAASTTAKSSLIVVTVIVMLIFAFVYKSQVVDRMSTLPKHGISPAKHGLFDCFKKPQTCLHVTFCMPVVAGKNYHAAEVMDFWPGCILTFATTYTPLWLIGAIIRAVLSVKVQSRLGTDESPLKACCVNLFCLPCDVGREGLEVDDELGAEITCCCNVKVAPRVLTEASNAKSRLCTAA